MQTFDIELLQGVIFDLDDTLVHSGLDFERIRAAVGCPDSIGVLEYIDTLPTKAEQNEAHEVVLDHERRGAEKATWVPGARAFLEALHQRGLPTAIVTRNAREIAELTLERLSIPVDLLLAREDAPPKPAPDGLLQIADHWRLTPSRIVYIGDFIYDLQAARNAGMIACYYDPARSGRFAEYADWTLAAFPILSQRPHRVAESSLGG